MAEEPALSPESVLRFLAARGGRARNAELLEHFRGWLSPPEPERRARARQRFKELVNAVATVRLEPGSGAKYVQLRRRYRPAGTPAADKPDSPPGDRPLEAGGSEAAAPLDPRAAPGPEPLPDIADTAPVGPPAAPELLPSIAVTPEEEADSVQRSRDSSPCPGGQPGEIAPAAPGKPDPEDGALRGKGPPSCPQQPPQAGSGSDLPRLGQVPPGGGRKRSSRRNVARGLQAQPGHGAEETVASARLAEEEGAEAGSGSPRSPGSSGGGATPRSGRKNFRELMMGSSPQLKRSFFPGAPRARGGDSDSASLASSSAEEESGGGSSVALDPLEHAWMLSAADGSWESLEGLLSCEPGLLSKRDFITGFTCLHWAAKHGRHELLAMLVNFAHKQRLPININARTSGGYTALHLAAMHGHLEVVKLLVGAYDADVDVRDYSGRKASSYLSQGTTEEMRSLVGALQEEGEGAVGNGSGRWRLSKVLPSNLITHKLSHHHQGQGEETESCDGAAALGKGKEMSRKASNSGRMKPRLNKIRFRTQIIHTTPSFRGEAEEEEEEQEEKPLKTSFKLRPKSNVFG
ncbi:ankyrin repeat domain-containing protein SOWAHC [Mauremys reevesii]|uniref:ankyrin repeat domain-containing protein SOWAHC n=1 Tax=Mauremys reevesii TaxID=260615 RepID=UPI00193FC509|nr:ankyrin repeat domain-containing protein SOWAHC [Mauremys reevesii]XP_039373955.1 ankyrin repeat domain-containing protein SOWAHC [Mauremys reevesii]XP_039373961.1 ankyrin repeat domain-containing protein SOWAHC [Mauremys reevesii]